MGTSRDAVPRAVDPPGGDLTRVHPDLRRATERLPHIDPSRRLVRVLSRVVPRVAPGHRVPGVTVSNARAGTVRVRLYRPDGQPGGAPAGAPAGAGLTPARGALLWVHGGGLVLGTTKVDDRHCGETARALGVLVVSVDYRLAPRHPYPAALDDVHAAWRWLLAHADRLGVDPARVAIGGQSAGGGLAAALALRLHDEGGTQPVGQWLFCPMLDDRTAARPELDAARHLIWDNRDNRYGWGAYLGHPPGAATAPEYAVPARRRDLSGLPPAWLDTGDGELFHDEITRYASRLRAAGVPTVLEVVPGAPHGFETWAADTRPARELLERARSWLGETLVGPRA